MNRSIFSILVITIFFLNINLTFSQSNENCFLNDFEEKTASIPPSVNAEKPSDTAAVTITIQG
ncbi:MAG TPA: hypothetical protein VLM39_04625, partial [Ignavibacteriaceae bacterium]|nr:hypothetical protein [Ignavibacteriaceae bacterium]